jgi:enamidase
MLRLRIEVALALAAVVSAAAATSSAQRGGDAARQFIKVQAPVVAIAHVRVIDGTGAPPMPDQTLVIRGGDIVAMGPAASTPVPDGATVVDGTGKSVMPGIVMLHEHLYYRPGPVCTASSGRASSASTSPAA